MNRNRNPNYKSNFHIEGYKNLGWQDEPYKTEEYKKCKEASHEIKQYDNSLFQNRGTHVVYFCDQCKIYWNIDMSD